MRKPCPRCLLMHSPEDERYILCGPDDRECYNDFANVAGDPSDVSLYRGVAMMLPVKDEGAWKDVADSAGGDWLVRKLLEYKDHDSKLKLLKQIVEEMTDG